VAKIKETLQGLLAEFNELRVFGQSGLLDCQIGYKADFVVGPNLVDGSGIVDVYFKKIKRHYLANFVSISPDLTRASMSSLDSIKKISPEISKQVSDLRKCQKKLIGRISSLAKKFGIIEQEEVDDVVREVLGWNQN
jgi:hypothetical protein